MRTFARHLAALLLLGAGLTAHAQPPATVFLEELTSPELAALESQRAKAYRVVRQYIVETPAGQVPP